MATFYIQLENKLLQISGDLTAENISKALGYVPVSPNVTNDLSQRVDNITFDSLKDNPFLQDGSGELNIVDEAGNIIAKVNAEGIHSVDFIAGNHKLTDKIDSSALNGYAKESWVTAEITKAATEGKVDLTGYATEEWVANQNYLTEHQDISHLATKDEVTNIDFYNIKDNPIVNNGDGKLLFVDENGYIGLQLEENGLYVKDVIADGHTLSQKADKSELSKYATKDEVSDLVDMSVVTELQGKVNTLIDTDADKSVRDIAVDVLTETLVSETATEAYDTLAEMSAWIKSHPEDAAAMNTAIQKNATDITNLDAAYKAADAKVLTDAQEYTDNINFYTIKDNPIVDGEAGSITFVDETGYIGLKVTEDGIIAKDVVTPEHTLSSKADKSFVEDNYYNKSTVDKKITEAVTGGQVSLDGFATEQWVNEQGFLKEHQDISHLAEKSELPTKVSELENDKGYITIDDVPEVTVPTKVSELENDSKFITINDIPEVTVPTKTSELTNDSGFITINDVPVLEIPEEYVTETELNDKGFLTEHQDISHLASRNWVESQGYAHQEDLLEISFNDIQDSPISIDDSGMINFVDESGNVGFQINEEGLRVTDVIAGDHKLSEKANASDIPSLDGYAKTEDIPSLDGLVKSEDLPNFDEFAKTEDIPSLDGYAKTKDIPSLDDYASKEWVNNKNYATEYDLKTIDYSSINNVPVSEDETGELNITDENGNIGMKVASEAVYAKDFVAGEHKLSEKVDKTYVDNSIAELVDGAPETLDTLNELATALNDNADIVDVLNQSISNKQDAITDLETIRQGAAKGATALQSYTEQYKGTVTGVKINGTTKNPSSGVVDLGTVITAHQDISGKQDKLVSGTNIKTINGQSIVGSGDITISGGGGDYLPLTGGTITGDLTLTDGPGGAGNFQSYTVNAKEFLSDIYYLERNGEHAVIMGNNKVEIINGVEQTKASIDWSGDGTKFLSNDGTYKTISISGGSSSGSGAYAEVNHGTSDTTFTLTPNTFHVWDEVSALTLTLGSETSGVANEFLFQFTSGSEATTLTMSDDIKWTEELVIEPNMIYQVSILKGLASVLSWDNALNLIENHITYNEGDFMNGGTITFEYPTASELMFMMNNYSSSKLLIPQGTTNMTIDWFEPLPPTILNITPSEDSIYKYIL